MQRTLCSCGSGKVFARCHGDPANEFARTQALAEARQVALLFPSVRLRSPAALGLAERLAAGLGEDEEIDEEALESAAIEVSEARRVVDEWVAAYPDRWSSLCHAAADIGAAERELVKGALAVAVHERLSTPRATLAALELAELSPLPSLAYVLPPMLVWSYDEARVAAATLPDLIDEVAAALHRVEHVDRVHRLAGLVARELPFRGFPRATDALGQATASVGEDIGAAREVATWCLVAYARELAVSYSTSRN